MDLSLVSLDDLIDEIEKRCPEYVVGVCRTDDGGEPIFDTYWSYIVQG